MCGQAEPGTQAVADLQQSDAVKWGRPVSGPPDPEVRRLRRLSRYVAALRSSAKLWVLVNCGQRAHNAGSEWGSRRDSGFRKWGCFKAVVKQQQNCQFKWHLRPRCHLHMANAPIPGRPADSLSIHLLERREQRVFFAPRNDRHRDGQRDCVARTVHNTKHCTTQKFRGVTIKTKPR